LHNPGRSAAPCFEMKFLSCILLLSCVCTSEGVTPVQKVLELMNGMLEKGKKEKHAEEVQFSAYKQWCSDTTTEKKTAISKANDAIATLKADIEKYSADAAQLTKEVQQHEKDIAEWTAEQNAATDEFKAAKADYEDKMADLGGSIGALKEGMKTMEAEDHNVAQSLIQMKQSSKLMNSVVEQAQTALAKSNDPKAAAFESVLGKIIEISEGLKDKFTEERNAEQKKFMNIEHAYNMNIQDISGQIKQAEADKAEKIGFIGQKGEAKGTAASERQDTIATRDADVKFLADTEATCEQKAADFSARQQLRAEEIEAIEKAIEIISSGDVAGNSEKHLPSLLQLGSAFLQIANKEQHQNQEKVAEFLRAQAQQLNSRVLSALALKVAADPFEKVKKMIQELIVRLMEEANEEAEQKGWCDTELSKNELTRKEKTDGVETLTARIDELTASVAKLTEEINSLTQQIAEIDGAVAKATELRDAEKAKNTETISDAKAAQTAVAQALEVLKEFYAKAAEATSFTQQPEIFDAPYKGQQSGNGGVVGMLEVIQSDFARLEAETKAAEEAGQKEYNEFMTDSKTNRAQMSTDVEHKDKTVKSKKKDLESDTGDLEATQKELDTANAVFDKLKPTCVDAGVSYEDRVARRKAEIQSLQEALQVLEGEELS